MIDDQFTLGVEEEYQIVHPETRDLRSYVSEIMEEGGRTILRERVRQEVADLVGQGHRHLFVLDADVDVEAKNEVGAR